MSHYLCNFLVNSELFSDDFLKSSDNRIDSLIPILEEYVN